MRTFLASPPHDVSTWNRKLPTWKQSSKKLLLIRIVVRNALRNWCHVHLKTLLCGGLLCIGMDRSGEKLSKLSAVLPLWSDCPLRTVIDGGRTYHVASNMAGTSAPGTKNFLRDVSYCNSRVAMTRLLRMLRLELVKRSSKKSCASLTYKTQTYADVCANSSSLTQHSTQEDCTMRRPTSSSMSEHC